MLWFLAPTVPLCAQQYEVVEAQIPSVQAKIITGAEMVNNWSASTWCGALVNVKIVITTPQVLLEALFHGFVQMSTLALLIFDEGAVLLFPRTRVLADGLSAPLQQEAPVSSDHE